MINKIRVFLFIISILSSLNLFSAAVNQLITGTVSLTSTSVTVSLCDSVDLSKTILLFTVNNNTANVGGNLVRGQLINQTTITFERAQVDGTPSISYQLIEYSSGVTVQRGSATITNSTQNVAINAVSSLSNSFPIVTMQNDGSTWGNDDGVIAEITSTTQLQFRCSSPNFDVYWQVVEYDSCVVQPFSISLSGTSATATLTAVNTNKTMLLGSHYQAGNINVDDMPRTELTNATTVTLTRVGSASTLTYFGYAVEFTDQTTVEQGAFSFGSGDLTNTQTISAIQDDRSIVYGTGCYGVQGSTTFNSNDNIGYNWATMSFASTTSVLATRTLTGSTAEIPFQVVSFRFNQTKAPAAVSDYNDPTGPFNNIFLNRIEKGTLTLGVGQTSNTATIASVDKDSTFMLFSIRVNTNAIGDGLVRGEITNSTTLTFDRNSSGSAVEIDYQVFYFQRGVWVQHGTTNLNSTSVNQAISSVNLSKAFVIASHENNGSAYGSDDAVTAEITSNTNLQFQSITNLVNNVNWQVIQMEDALVRKVVFTLEDGVSSLTQPISTFTGGCSSSAINGLTVNNSFVVGNHAINGDVNADDLPRVELTDTNDITVTRVGSSSALPFVLYVVELFDGTTIQHGTVTISGTNTIDSTRITSFTNIASGYIPSGNLGRQGSTTFNSDDDLGYPWASFSLTNSTTVVANRAGNSNATSVFPFQVISFQNFRDPPLPVDLLSFTVTKSKTDAVLNWVTASEINNKEFVVEHSADGKLFKAIGAVDGVGNSNTENNYQFIDNAPLNGLNYYRLIQVDFDGKSSKSNVKSIFIDNNELVGNIEIYPNPAFNEVVINSGNVEIESVAIYNQLGALVKSINQINNNNTLINLSGFDKGVYYLAIKTFGGINTKRLVICAE